MLVRELIEALQNLDRPDSEVQIQQFSPENHPTWWTIEEIYIPKSEELVVRFE